MGFCFSDRPSPSNHSNIMTLCSYDISLVSTSHQTCTHSCFLLLTFLALDYFILKGYKVTNSILLGQVLGVEADPVLGSQPAGDSMHSHEPSGGPPGPQRHTHMHSISGVINPAVGYHYFLPDLQLPSQLSGITGLSSERPI